MSLVGAWYSGGGTAALSHRLIMPLIADSALPYLRSELSLSDTDGALSLGPRCALDYHIDRLRHVYASRLEAMLEGID